MTCEEVERLSNKHPTKATRAERAAFAKHVENCPNCMRRMLAQVAVTGPLTPEEEEVIDRLCQADMQDPEAS